MIPMFETHNFLKMLVSRKPLTEEDLQVDRIQMELQDIKEEIERLKKKSSESDSARTARFDRYLDTLDARRIEVRQYLDAVKEHGEGHWDHVHRGLREAQQRLAIAKLAARSRFH